MIKISNKHIDNNSKTFFIAEIGINHNGSIKNAEKLIKECKKAGADAVKFQKRTIEKVYSSDELMKPRDSVFGKTNGDLKRGLEFSKTDYQKIDKICKDLDIIWFASCWDIESVDFMEDMNVPCYKIASASLTDKDLLNYTKNTNKPIILSTGMSTEDEIEKATRIIGEDKLIILHCTSSYPCAIDELNLSYIHKLKEKYKCPIGYSGHEVGLSTTLAAVAMGAKVVERHVTLDRSLWGSDQSASIEPVGLNKLIRDIKAFEQALGDGKKIVYDTEKPILEKLRKINTI